MKPAEKIVLVCTAVITLVLGYLLGSYYPITGFKFLGLSNNADVNIEGNALLNVFVVTDQGAKVPDLEVDIGIIGPGNGPQLGTSAITNENGTATFELEPGDYLIFFNMNNFPSSLEWFNTLTSVTVTEGETNEKTITLVSK